MEVDSLSEEVARAEEVAKGADPAAAVPLLKALILREADETKLQEKCCYTLADLLAKLGRKDELKALQVAIRPFLATLPKARTAKIVRLLIEYMAKIPGTEEDQIGMCTDCIEWCQEEKRTFLRRRVETRLCSLYLQQQKYQPCLTLLATLLIEVKKIDDKLLLVEIYLIETKTQFMIEHMAKAKSSLTACKTNANAIHCPPLLQAEIDMWSGIVHAREGDFRTCFSYLYESFEAFNVASDPRAQQVLKYMLLSKIMANKPGEARQLAATKATLKYEGPEYDALLAVATALEKRSLTDFEQTLAKYKVHLSDPVVQHHMTNLNETLLEQNLLRLVEPFTRVEVAHVAELIKLPLDRVLPKLAEMILDKKLDGTLDEGQGALVVHEKENVNDMYSNALVSIKNTQEVLDTLYSKAMRVK